MVAGRFGVTAGVSRTGSDSPSPTPLVGLPLLGYLAELSSRSATRLPRGHASSDHPPICQNLRKYQQRLFRRQRAQQNLTAVNV